MMIVNPIVLAGNRRHFTQQIYLWSLFALCLAWIPVKAETPAPIHRLEISSPRDFGIVMGDTISSEIRVKMEVGYQLETANLPKPGSAVSDYLEVRKLDWSQQTQDNETLFNIHLVYQVFKGVREPEILSVPAISMRFKQDDKLVETEAPAWSFTLSPIISNKLLDEAVILRGDLPLPDIDNSKHWQWMGIFISGLIGLLFYAAWHLGLPPFNRRTPPFVRAASALKKLNKQPASLKNYRQGIKLLHDALNETADYSLFVKHLPKFLEEYPQYQHLKLDLEQFFATSNQAFFATATTEPADYTLTKMEKLCRELAKSWHKKQ